MRRLTVGGGGRMLVLGPGAGAGAGAAGAAVVVAAAAGVPTSPMRKGHSAGDCPGTLTSDLTSAEN